MEKLQFDEGIIEFEINGDANRVIKVMASDFGIFERFEEVKKNIEEYKAKIEKESEKGEIELIREIDEYIYQQFDYAFNSKVSDAVFMGCSPLSLHNGQTYAERFLEAITPMLKKKFDKELKAQEKRIDKYKSNYDRFTSKKS